MSFDALSPSTPGASPAIAALTLVEPHYSTTPTPNFPELDLSALLEFLGKERTDVELKVHIIWLSQELRSSRSELERMTERFEATDIRLAETRSAYTQLRQRNREQQDVIYQLLGVMKSVGDHQFRMQQEIQRTTSFTEGRLEDWTTAPSTLSATGGSSLHLTE